MAQRFWKTEKFKKLQTEWKKKLAASGFVDHEDEKQRLKQNASNSYRTVVSVTIDAKRRYYDLLGQGCAAERGFRDFVEAFVMKRRAKGVKIKQICGELREMDERCHRQTIRFIIQSYEKKWHVKTNKV